MRFAAALAVLTLACAGTVSVSVAGKPAPPPNYTVADSIALRDAPPTIGVQYSGDGVTSDGLGDYPSAQGNTLQVFNASGGTGDFTFTLSASRAIHASLTSDRYLPDSRLPGIYPNTVVACTTGSVLAIAKIAPNSSATTTAAFGCNGLTASDLVQFGPHGGDGAGTYSTTVTVNRSLDGHTWTVSTDTTPAEAVYTTQTSKHPVRTGFAAEFILPFQLTISCSNCN
jgi:hypothetical protein